MTAAEINNLKCKICCPLCDNKKCVRGSAKCEAEIWAEKIKKDMAEGNGEEVLSD
jgi:hypothetical protein